MNGDLGESAKLALSYTLQICQKLQFDYIGTEHLFLGVMELQDASIMRQFSRAGADVEEISKAMLKRIGRGTWKELEQVSMTPRVQRILENAAEMARWSGRDEVEAPDILRSILEDGRGVAARVIMEKGGHLEEIAKYLKEMVSDGDWSPEFYKERKSVEQRGIDSTSELMENLGRDLTELAASGELDPIIGREKEILQTIQILMSKKKHNPVLVGEAGVGKTAVVEGLAQLLVSGNPPPQMRGKRIRTMEVGALLAGTMYRGSFESKLLDFVKEAREDKDLIVFIDEMHMLIGAGRAEGVNIDAANILKPALARGDFMVIGATTYNEYRKYVESDPALARRFQPVYVGETTPEDTLQILQGLRRRYEDFHDVKIMDSALDAAVQYSHRYINDRRLPDKAIDLVDQACSQKKLRTYYGFSELSVLTDEQKKALYGSRMETPTSGILLITEDDIARTVAAWTGIPVGKLTEKESDRLVNLESLIKKRLVGQDEAALAVAQSIRTSRAGLADARRPVGSFLFLGPTGAGKTELARTLAEILFYDEEKIIRVDMSECYDAWFISRLIGSPHGYVDSDRGGQLTEAVKKNPYSIVLFDEVEKADGRVLDLLLQILDEGRLTDGLGRTVDFRNTIVIMTSNVGSSQISEHVTVGFDIRSEEERKKGLSKKEVAGLVKQELKLNFRPEFLNRIDEVVIFNPLSREDLRDIARLMLAKIPMIKVEAGQPVLHFLVDARFDPAMGARPLRRTITDMVVEPLANKVIEGKYHEGDVVRLGLSDGRVTFRKKAVRRDE